MRRQFFPLLACGASLLYAAAAAAVPSGPRIGSIAPEFDAYNMLSGEKTPLSSQRGKVVILTFWASWCGPCRRELPKLASVWHINMIEDRGGSVASRYSISSIPHLFIIGRDGKVLANHLGYGNRTLDELVADINHALSETTLVEREDSHAPGDSTQ